ncbi:hypothetical protein JCM8097_001422 [Rhodosporidiobolus ruineniae]
MRREFATANLATPGWSPLPDDIDDLGPGRPSPSNAWAAPPRAPSPSAARALEYPPPERAQDMLRRFDQLPEAVLDGRREPSTAPRSPLLSPFQPNRHTVEQERAEFFNNNPSLRRPIQRAADNDDEPQHIHQRRATTQAEDFAPPPRPSSRFLSPSDGPGPPYYERDQRGSGTWGYRSMGKRAADEGGYRKAAIYGC